MTAPQLDLFAPPPAPPAEASACPPEAPAAAPSPWAWRRFGPMETWA